MQYDHRTTHLNWPDYQVRSQTWRRVYISCTTSESSLCHIMYMNWSHLTQSAVYRGDVSFWKSISYYMHSRLLLLDMYNTADSINNYRLFYAHYFFRFKFYKYRSSRWFFFLDEININYFFLIKVRYVRYFF